MEPTSHPGDILRETREAISEVLGKSLETMTVEKTVMGLFFTGIKLNSGEGGLCFTPIKSIPEAVCCPSSARVMPGSATGLLQGSR